MKKVLFSFMIGAMVVSASLSSAVAFPYFNKEFVAVYVKEAPATPEETALKAAVGEAKCGVCHMGDTKKMRNAYGVALDAILAKDDKDPAVIQDALKKVAEEKAPNGKTFGENLAAGKLPAAE